MGQIENKETKDHIAIQTARLAVAEDRMERLEEDKKQLQQENEALNEAYRRIHGMEQAYYEITTSRYWRITAPLRKIVTWIKKLLLLLLNTVRSMRQNGVKATIWKARHYHGAAVGAPAVAESVYIMKHWPTEKELEAQRKSVFQKDITFSVLVPLYNTPEPYLREMIASVTAQTYGKWELCLADGSDTEHAYVGNVVQEYANKDPRIQYKKLERNDGISGNTNVCLDMASGDYIALFDHDDLLHPSALYKNMEYIEKEGADFLYSDEMTFEGKRENCVLIHFKPDFSADTLRSHNYICHFTVYSRSLLEKVGYFSDAHNGSQDYDMVLRLTEQAQKIAHIPEVIYFWRRHPGSVASDISAKPYCIISARKAIGDHLERIGLKGTVVDSDFISSYRIKYAQEGEPLVSILIANKESKRALDNCLSSIFRLSTYLRFEVIVIENGSTDESLFAYYKNMQCIYSNLKVVSWEGDGSAAELNRFGVSQAKGDYLLFLQNDTEIITPDWLESMLMLAQRKDVGAVGAKLFHPNGTIAHAGLILGMNDTVGHSFLGWGRDDPGYSYRLCVAQNLSCVSGACLMTKRAVWDQVNGMDPLYHNSLYDADYCLKARKAGYQVVFTPYAKLYHQAANCAQPPELQEQSQEDTARFQQQWDAELKAGDPFFNPNLSLDDTDFRIAN